MKMQLPFLEAKRFMLFKVILKNILLLRYMKPHFKPFSYFLYKFDGLVARHLDAFLVNSITNMDAFLLNFRCDY